MLKNLDFEKIFSSIKFPSEALYIIEHLQSSGFQAAFAGGCVRDSLLGKIPEDWDIVTSASPEQIESLFARTYAIGKAFGIINVCYKDKVFEVASFRSDGQYIDGRRPETVQFSTMEEDLERRDFTVNAMLYDPVAKKIYDLHNGIDDLEKKIIRCVGNPQKRFQEDKLRILRAIRFAANLNFEIEEETWQALCQESKMITQVSMERISTELEKMLTNGQSAQALELLRKSSLLKIILPDVDALQGIQQPAQFHPEGDVWQHTHLAMEILDKNFRRNEMLATKERFFEGKLANIDRDEKRILAWAVLLHDVGKKFTFTETDRIRFHNHDCVGAEMAERILRKLKLPNKIINSVSKLVRQHMSLISFREMREAKKINRLRENDFPLLLELNRIDTMASHEIIDLHEEILAAWEIEQKRELPVKAILNGKDLLKLGLKAGPQFKQILQEAQDKFLEKKLNSKEEAINWVRKKYLQKNN